MTRIPYPLRDAWAITEEGASKILDIWETAHATGRAERIAAALEARDGEPLKNERNISISGGVAVVSIDGPLMRKAELFTDISGATSYQWIGAAADKCRADSQIKMVLFKFNTPGGEAAGCGECGEKIARLAAEKPTEAYVETLCASAGLWLAAQCGSITAHPTAELGWVGAVRTMVDTSEQDAKNGIRRKQLVSRGAEAKRTDPLTDAVVERAQVRVDEIGALFTAAVAKGRDVTVKKVLSDFGGGDGMIAARALAVGLIDRLSDFDSTLARLTGDENAFPPSMNGVRMGNNANPSPVRVSDSDNEWACGKCSEMMGPSAKKFCSKCVSSDDDGDEDDDKEDAKALAAVGLLGKTRKETRARLVAFASSAIEATGAKTSSTAIVALLDHAKAKADLTAYRAESEKQAATARTKAVGDKLGAALLAGKVQLGAVAKEVALLSGAPKAAIRANLAAIGEGGSQDGATIVAAITSAGVSEELAASVDEWLESKGASALPAVHRSAAENDQAAITATTPPAGATTVNAADATKFGLDPKKHGHLFNVNSVADLPRPARKE